MFDDAAAARSLEQTADGRANPSSRPCQNATSSSPSCQQSRIVLAVALRREVDQARVEILDQHAQRLDLAHRRARASSPPRRPRPAASPSSRRRDAAAVARRSAARSRRAAPARRRARASPSTIASTSGRSSASAAFASSGVKTRGRHRTMIGLLVSTGQRLRLRDREHASASLSSAIGRARGPPLEIFLWSRAAIWAAALFALARLRAEPPPARRPLGRPVADARPRLGDGRLGALGQRLVPAHRRARLRRRAARRRGRLLPALPAHARRRSAASSAATTCSPGSSSRSPRRSARSCCSTGSPRPRLGADGARRAVLYLAVFPMALFLQAVYSESLFLAARARGVPARRARPLAGAGVLDRARDADADRGRRAAARARGHGLAPAAGERRRALASLCARAADLRRLPAVPRASQRGDAFAFARSQGFWNRHLSAAGPLGGIWDGSRAAWAGVRQLVSGSHTHYYWSPVRDADPMRVAAVNLEAFAFLVLLVALTVDRVAPLRRAVRSLRSRQPGDPAERAERALAAALDAAIRARPLPLLPRARHPRRSAAGAYRDPRGELDHARRRRHPVGPLAMGRVARARRRRAPRSARLPAASAWSRPAPTPGSTR